MKRYEDPSWAERMALRLDHNYAMAEFVGKRGLNEAELEALTPRLARIHEELMKGRQSGRLGFYTLPYQQGILKEIKQISKPFLEWCWEFVVLGIGGSALGAKALHQALCHPHHNRLPLGRKQHKPSLWVLDNIEPDTFYGLLDGLEWRRLAVNVISKSGSTAETLAQLLFIYQALKVRVGEEKARERLIITTDPDNGSLRRLAEKENFHSLSIQPEVGGRFSVLTPVGLFPAAMVGIDVEELLAGARFMDQRLSSEDISRNLAYRLASLYYVSATAQGRPILVVMPYASSLAAMADWFCQLWAESLGKRHNLQGQVVEAGSTPVRAVGVTDQHSQMQLYMEGPHDKLITLWEVENFHHTMLIPRLFEDLEHLSYLGGRTVNELFRAEQRATAFNLMKAGRPSLSLILPEINAFTMGQLIMLLEVVTVAAAGLFGVNSLDQPGVEGSKQTTYGLMGRPGFERFREELEEAAPRLDKYVLG